MTRDLLRAEIPTVLRADLNAVAVLAGAAVVVIGAAPALPPIPVTIAGAVLCFGVQFIVVRRHWHLPIAEEPGQPPAPEPKERKDNDAGRL